MTTHEEAVSQIAATVKSLFDRGESYRIFHGSTNSTRPFHNEQVVDISALSNVLDVDRVTMTAVVEPNVPMDRLVRATLEYGLIPSVVMEFPGITVGGGYVGTAGESSSFKYGYFSDTIRRVEMILANGEIITASPDEHADLFKGAAGAMGTLGITTKLELTLIKARRFVKVHYRPYSSIRETIAAIQEAIEDTRTQWDYIDSIVYSKSHGLVMTGRLTDDIPPGHRPQSFSAASDPWFYTHAKSRSREHESVEYIPIAEYLFRYDRGGFWVGASAFKYFMLVPFNRVTRWLLNDFLHTRPMYRALHGSNMSFAHMIQDLALPYDKAEDFIEYTAEQLGIWPLWLCPLRAIEPPTFHPYGVDATPNRRPIPMLNIGLWGTAAKNLDKFIQQNKDLEVRVTELGGRKVLYSHTYYTEEEFWRLYDRKWYERLRETYVAGSLPTVYDKIRVDGFREKILKNSGWISWVLSLRPLPGFVGIYHALRSKDYLLHRNLEWMKWRVGHKELEESDRDNSHRESE